MTFGYECHKLCMLKCVCLYALRKFDYVESFQTKEDHSIIASRFLYLCRSNIISNY